MKKIIFAFTMLLFTANPSFAQTATGNKADYMANLEITSLNNQLKDLHAQRIAIGKKVMELMQKDPQLKQLNDERIAIIEKIRVLSKQKNEVMRKVKAVKKTTEMKE